MPLSDPPGDAAPASATRAFEPEEASSAGPQFARLGDYRILREVGRGGMGIVYEAEQESLGRHVALKVLPSSARLNPTYLERFRREAKAAAQLHHTNIVPVFGVGEHDGISFYAMQFIRGDGLDKVLAELRALRRPLAGAEVALPPEGSLARCLLTGQFAPPTVADLAGPLEPSGAPPSTSGPSMSGPEAGHCRSVARVGAQVADALAYAHRQGILHRDVKPSNLLLDAQGTVWVTDFGLAKAEGAEELTQTGDFVGTLRFMAPERFEGISLPQSDVYALGLTLYELLTLRAPFEDTNKGRLIEKVLREPPLAPRAVGPRIPRDLETIVLKCLAKEPAQRYPTADALAEDLRRFLADRPIKARRTPWHERTWRWCRRNPGWAAMLAVSLTSLIVMAVGGALLSLHLSAALAQSRQAEQDRKKQLFESLVSQAKAQRSGGRVGQRFGTLASIQKAAALARELGMPPSTFDELRDLAISALTLPDIHLVKEWEGWPEGSRALAFDATWERYARLDARGNVTVRRVADDVEIASRPGEGPNVTLGGFEEGGGALILLDATDKSRKRWRFDASPAVPLGRAPALFSEDNWGITTADHKLLVTLHRKTGVVSVHDVASGKHLRDVRFDKRAKGAHAAPDVLWDMHPWRHELAISMGAYLTPERRVVRILDLDKGTVQAELDAGPGMTTHGTVSWHPDGKTLAVAYAQSVLLWDVPSRKHFPPIADHKGGGLTVSVSRSGQLMSTSSGWMGGVKFWHPYTRKLLLTVPSLNVHPSAPAPDGRMYTYRIDGTRIQLWATEPSPVLRVLVRGPARGPVGEYRRSSIHPNGRLLAVGSSQGVSLFDLSSGLDVGHLDLGYNVTTQFDPSTGDLLTFGTLGLFRWPVRSGSGGLRIGPPKCLVARGAADNEFRISCDGRIVAVAQFSRVLVLHADRPGRPVVLEPTKEVRQQLSISPDGRWIATGSHWTGDVLLWEASTGRVVKRQRGGTDYALVQFSPDGKRLLVFSTEGSRFWRVRDWEEIGPAIEKGGYGRSAPEFSPDGQFLAWESGEGALRLIDTTTGRDLARLESPDQGRCEYTTFSQDGRLLITTNRDYPAVHVWDLHELRKQLKEMGLDWDAPPCPTPAEDRAKRFLLPSLDVEIDTGGLKGPGKGREVATQRNNEAWHLVAGDAKKRDPARALKLIRQALADDPDNPTYLNTLGVVQYRGGQSKEAVASLEKSLAAGNGESDGYDLFFLAMCHARLGNAAAARERFNRAVKWLEGQKGLSAARGEELKAFRAEAEDVLGNKPRPK